MQTRAKSARAATIRTTQSNRLARFVWPTLNAWVEIRSLSTAVSGEAAISRRSYTLALEQTPVRKKQVSLTTARGGSGPECTVGYTDKLCGVCESEVNGTLYARQGSYNCGPCASLAIQLTQIVGVLLLVIVYAAYMV